MVVRFGHMLMCCFHMCLCRSMVVVSYQFGCFFVRLGGQLQMLGSLGVVLLHCANCGGVVRFVVVKCHLDIFQKLEKLERVGHVHLNYAVILAVRAHTVCLLTHDACDLET